MTDEQRVKEVYPDADYIWLPVTQRYAIRTNAPNPKGFAGSGMDVEEAWADAASRLPKAEVAPEHPRADCEGCGDPNCPCNLIDADGFLEWWRDNNQRFEASDSFTHPIDYALAAWNAAKASSPVVAGGESDNEAYNRGIDAAIAFLTEWKSRRDYIQSAGFFAVKISALKQPLIKEVRGKE